MSRNRVAAFVILAAVVLAVISFHSAVALAAGKTTFTWSTYMGKDGKTYNLPSWNDATGKRTFDEIYGILSFAQTPPMTKVIFKVYRHAPQGGWNAAAVITYQLNPAPSYVGFPINGWPLSGADTNTPRTQFDEGEEIKIVWEVTTTQNNVPTVSLVESIITVNYHAH